MPCENSSASVNSSETGAGAPEPNDQAAAMDPVKLIASDGTEIILDRQAAMVSGTIKSMLGGPGVGATPLPPRAHASLPQPPR